MAVPNASPFPPRSDANQPAASSSTPPLPPSAAPSSPYMTPTKRILSAAHLRGFQRSAAHAEIVAFIDELNDAVVDKRLEDAGEGSERTRPLLAILAAVRALADTIPPVENASSRFGNPAFRTFYDALAAAAPSWHAAIPGMPAAAVGEVAVYFCDSWGNRQRVDYGSGMELNFVLWLLCLRKLGLLTPADDAHLVLAVFNQYILVMRHLQSTYWLEPAGSHGVWGLDDYQFLPFLWGAGQLKHHKHLRPKSIHSAEILAHYAPSYLYLSSVAFINSIKTVSLRWHSPMLDDISAVKTWAKVNEGMGKMYRAEVLGKLPVMQHLMFGSLLAWHEDDQMRQEVAREERERDGKDGHAHNHGAGWTMDCCGISVPSAFPQAQAEQAGTLKIAPRAGLRPIPFD
ncbi:Serine/threonine-protein phosphatase 2A activator 2 [Cryptotrichosporon argae]